MISLVFSAASFSSSELLVLVISALVAASGGILVFIGLCLEKAYEKEIHPHSGDARKYRSKRTLGFTLLMVGIGVEVLLAIAHTFIGARELNAVKQIAAASDPRDFRISDITAKAGVEVSGPLGGGDIWAGAGVDFSSFMTFMESNAPPNTLYFGEYQVLYVDSSRGHETTSNGPTTHGYAMNFRSDPRIRGAVTVIKGHVPATPRIILERINWVQLTLAVVPPRSEVLEGSVEVLINGTFRKHFTIPRQFCATNGTFYATNSP